MFKSSLLFTVGGVSKEGVIKNREKVSFRRKVGVYEL